MLCNIIYCVVCCIPATIIYLAKDKLFSKEELTGAIDPSEMSQLKNSL